MNKNTLLGINSSLKTNPTSTTYPEYTRNQLQDKVNRDWDFASDVYAVKKMNQSKVWEDLTVRLTFPYDIKSSSSIKDDFKTVLFKDLQYNALLGEMWQFSNYYWMTIDTGRNKSSTSSCMIQRCSDALRWYDENGLYHELPCVIERNSMYDLDNDRIMTIPTNQTRVLVKWDDESKLIKWADVNSTDDKFTRFILNGYAYRTVSIDRHSFIRNGIGYLDIRLVSDMIKDSDDLINNIADGLNQNTTIDITNGNSTVTIGQNLQLNTVVTRNGIEVVSPVISYTSATPTVATIDINGLISALSTGSSLMTATYGNVSDSTLISATPIVSNNYTLEFNSSIGNLSTLKLNQSSTYTVTALNNGVSYADTFTFNVTDDTGLSPSNVVSIVSQTSNSIVLKANNISTNVNQYFRLYAVGTNKTDYIRIQIKGLF